MQQASAITTGHPFICRKMTASNLILRDLPRQQVMGGFGSLIRFAAEGINSKR